MSGQRPVLGTHELAVRLDHKSEELGVGAESIRITPGQDSRDRNMVALERGPASIVLTSITRSKLRNALLRADAVVDVLDEAGSPKPSVRVISAPDGVEIGQSGNALTFPNAMVPPLLDAIDRAFSHLPAGR